MTKTTTAEVKYIINGLLDLSEKALKAGDRKAYQQYITYIAEVAYEEALRKLAQEA